jgi:uncharacterized protein YbaR (Trm112 family)
LDVTSYRRGSSGRIEKGRSVIDPQLMGTLVCPETRSALHVAGASVIAQLNRLAAQGQLSNRVGRPLEGPIDGGLIREDGKLLFPIIDGIPVMLVDEAIPMEAE